MKKQFYRAAAATVLGLSLTTGIVAADNSGSIGTTGPDSNNNVTANTTVKHTVSNDNDVRVSNSNHQTAKTGKAEAEDNTTAGGAASGDASNSNSVAANLTVNNSAGGAGAAWSAGSTDATGVISGPTGPDSNNNVTSNITTTTKVTNDNDLSVHNSNHQTATSGSAEVEHNTTGGSATTGDATNTSSSTFTFSVTN